MRKVKHLAINPDLAMIAALREVLGLGPIDCVMTDGHRAKTKREYSARAERRKANAKAL